MATAILGYKNKNSDSIYTLDTGSLRYIDNITSDFHDETELKRSSEYVDKIKIYSGDNSFDNGELVLSYIKSNQKKVVIPILYDDEETIRTRTSSLEEKKSETERARRLLLNSKNNMFLTLFMLNDNLKDTTYHTVKMSLKEYKIAKASGLNVFIKDNEYHIPMREVFKYRLNHSKLGPMRLLVEDTLEAWKNHVMNLPNEELYFYSRELRVLLNEYDYRKMPRQIVCHFQFNNRILNRTESFRIKRTIDNKQADGLSKQKVLEDRRTA